MTRKIFMFAFGIYLHLGWAYAIEQVNNTAPYVINPSSTTFWRVSRLVLDQSLPDQGKSASISVILFGSSSVTGTLTKQFTVYESTTAVAKIRALNKANLTSNSLQKRILQELIDLGILAGSVSGNPD